MAQKSGRAKGEKKDRSRNDKGRLVEDIVALLHISPGVEVETRVHIPVPGEEGETREIDVLLSGQLADYRARVAIECKNEARPIGEPYIDTFIGKLQDLDIPRQMGIYVAVNGFTKKALRRAQKAGIRTLVLSGLTSSRLGAAVGEAFRSVIHLLAVITKMRLTNEAPEDAPPDRLFMLHTVDEERCTFLPDLLWNTWIAGEAPASLCDHQLTVSVPDGWCQLIGGKQVKVEKVDFEYRVYGAIISLGGHVEQFTLTNAATQQVEKGHVSVRFPSVEAPRVQFPVTMIRSEDEFLELLRKRRGVQIVTRVRLPRIRWDTAYWPPSQRVVAILQARMRAFEAGDIDDPRPKDITELEGTDLNVFWEPVWEGHPAAAWMGSTPPQQAPSES